MSSCRLAGVLALMAVVVAPVGAARLRVGEEVTLGLETPHPYQGRSGAEPVLVWTETIYHPGATYIAPRFARFELADGDHVVVRSPDGGRAWRYEGLGRGGLGLSEDGFWSSRIPGDTAVVELFSRNASGAYGFRMSGYARGLDVYEINEANDLDPTVICGGDDNDWAACYAQTEPEIYEHSRAVARLHIGGTFLCTGWLVGCEGHLITNNHCIANAATALNTDYEFMAEGSDCETHCLGLLACPGTIEATGAPLVRTSIAEDYALMALPAELAETYGYLTLRAGGARPEERIYIPQHPGGWGKQIAVHSTHPSDGTGFCEIETLSAPPCSGSGADLGYFADTRPGSSGSPVLAYDDHRVVALHHCGGCPNRGIPIADVMDSLGSDLPSCSLDQFAGAVSFDRPAYRCSDTIEITVVDSSLLGSSTQDVTVRSTIESDPETLTLVETGAGVFVATMPVGTGAAVAGDGALSVEHDATVTVTYVDADDGSRASNVIVERQTTIDCVPPAISAVTVREIELHGATVRWTTDEPTGSRVTYGTTSPPASIAESLEPVSEHAVVLDGLLPCTDHLFSVTSVDLAGNSTTDDGAGSFYSFETVCVVPLPIPDGSGESRPVVAWIEDGGDLTIAWDDRCPPLVTNLLYGSLDAVANLAVQGAECSAASPLAWNDPPEGNLWFIVVGTDGLETESSWGLATDGERNGATPSGQCSTSRKNSGGVCP